jgi:hypothetical protein
LKKLDVSRNNLREDFPLLPPKLETCTLYDADFDSDNKYVVVVLFEDLHACLLLLLLANVLC